MNKIEKCPKCNKPLYYIEIASKSLGYCVYKCNNCNELYKKNK